MPQDRNSRSRSRKIGNEERLVALGEAIDRRGGVTRTAKKKPAARRRKKRGGRRQTVLRVGLAAAVVGIGFAGGSYLYAQWRFSKVTNVKCGEACLPTLPGQPFNILSIGSDSRVGLTGAMAAQTGAGGVSGQRSDVIKIIHVDPSVPSISVISIPRDTLVTLQPAIAQYFQSKYQRINVNLVQGASMTAGPQMLAKTITANFGIPINHIVEVSFGGLANSVIALGGVYMSFPHTSADTYSGLRINTTGCQHLTGMQALSVARSRHFYYSPHNYQWTRANNLLVAQRGVTPAGWVYDGTSDYGRIKRQDAFLRAMMLVATKEYNPFTINDVLSKLPAGVQLDSSFSLNTLIGLAVKFHSYDPNSMQTYTLPVVSPGPNPYGSVLTVDQYAAQQLFVKIFGATLVTETTPAPNSKLQSILPPHIPVPSTTSTSTTVAKHKKHTTTTTTTPPYNPYFFNPVPCTPGAKKK
jgi:LCP family protein required for cell wall assembly